MTRIIFVVGLWWPTLAAFGQTVPPGSIKLLTSKYAGTYSYGSDMVNGRVGTILIYPETDSTILFYLDLNRGEPSYNMGSDYGRIKIVSSQGTYYTIESGADKGCKWDIQFKIGYLAINTIDEQDNCGFGYGVYPDGTFTQTSKMIPDFFENQEGEIMYFKDIK